MNITYIASNNGNKKQNSSTLYPSYNRIVKKRPEQESELNQLIGLKEVKKTVEEIKAYIQVQQRRIEHGLKANHLNLHMLFKGNPGTGKSAVARALESVLLDKSVIKSGRLIEVERADLVGEYIGHTAQKTREQVEKAQGGILFVDEAYSLGRGGRQDFGKEAIDVLVKSMEDCRQDFILILAGYPREMDNFLNLNPGLSSRISIYINFPDFTVNELLQIVEKMAYDYQYKFTVTARSALRKHFSRLKKTGKTSYGNARMARNILEKSIRKQAVRLVNQADCTREELTLLHPEDLDLDEEKWCTG